MRRVFAFAAALLLTACGVSPPAPPALPAPEYFSETPVGSGTWSPVPAEPAWVANPPAREGHLRFVASGQSDLRSIAAHGNRPSAEKDAAGFVESALLPVVGAEDAAKAAAAAGASLRMIERACREELLTRNVVPGNSLCTAWALWEIPLDPILAALPEEKRTAARATLVR
jgi:hypothetical protein